jgi:hypothetical protein
MVLRSLSFGSVRAQRSLAALTCLGLAFAAGTTLAAPPQDPPPRDCSPVTDEPLHGGLPYFDARLDGNEAPVAAVAKAVDAARALRAQGRAADESALRALVPTVKIQDSPLIGTPQVVLSTSEFLTPASPSKALDVVRGFVAAYPGLFEISPAELDAARVPRDFVTDHNGVHSFTFQQQIKGVDLFDCEVRANVMPDGRLINIGSRMLPRPDGDFVVKAPRLTDLDAVRFAAQSAGVDYTIAITPKTDQEGPSLKRTWNNTADFRTDEPIVTELVYFPMTRDDIRTAWSVFIPVKGVGHAYDIIIDASTGELLHRQDRLVWDLTPMTFRVFTSDGVAPGSPGTSTPTGFQFPEVPRTLLTINPSDISAYSPQGWINAGVNDTEGNNVDAHLDLNADNVPDPGSRPDGGASRTFDLPFSSAADPTTWQPFAVAEMFWRVNWYHDQLMQLGFNEAAHNFQTVNFSGQGVGGDAVQADVQDGSGTNNANFSTSGADGSSARVQMYVFTGPTPHRDGALDGDIVYHEMTHGTSTRLHGGLSGTQAGGMGEGWSDFYGIMLLAEPGDDPNAVYCTAGYTTYLLGTGFVNNYYFGIRRYPYSRDMTKSPLTFKDLDTAQASAHPGVPRSPVIGNSAIEVHNEGEVWCTTLMDARANFWNAYGFPGNQRMLQVVTDGMKLSLLQTTDFLHERDAIIQADMADYGGIDGCFLWEAFARRGMGSAATTPAGGATTGLVEDYTLPPGEGTVFSFPGGLPAQLQPGVGSTFAVNISTGIGGLISPGTEQILISRNGGTFVASPLSLVSPGQYTATIAGGSCFDNVRYYFSASVTGNCAGTATEPRSGAAGAHAAITATQVVYVNENFETANPAWTAAITRAPGETGTMTGLWERAIPVGNVQTTPQTAHTGQYCWVTQNGTVGELAGATDVDNAITTLTSPAYDLSAAPASTTVSYWRWFSNNAGSNPNTQTFLVDVSLDNGVTWTRAETVGPTTQNTGGWLQGSWTFASLGLAPTSQVRVRFTAQDLIGAVVEAAVDDLLIYSYTCQQCGSADFNCDGAVATDADIEAFFACISGSCPPPPCTSTADFNHDGAVGTDEDIESFFRVLSGAPC